MDTNVILKIDGKEIAFNDFVGKVFSDINLAVIKNLKGIDLDSMKEIELIISKDE